METESPLEKWVSTFLHNPEALSKTKERESKITAAYQELLSGYNADPSDILTKVADAASFKGLVSEKDIKFMSFCQHHFLPFFGSVDIIYEPGDKLIGLGKIPRLVDVLSKRLQFQENLTQQIVDEFMNSGGAKGVYVLSKAHHLCMGYRGPSDPNAYAQVYSSDGTLSGEGERKALALLETK